MSSIKPTYSVGVCECVPVWVYVNVCVCVCMWVCVVCKCYGVSVCMSMCVCVSVYECVCSQSCNPWITEANFALLTVLFLEHLTKETLVLCADVLPLCFSFRSSYSPSVASTGLPPLPGCSEGTQSGVRMALPKGKWCWYSVATGTLMHRWWATGW